MKRKPGEYWVVLNGTAIPQIAWYDGTGPTYSWFVGGLDEQLGDSDFSYIGPEPIEFPGIDENGEFPNGRDAAKLLTL